MTVWVLATGRPTSAIVTAVEYKGWVGGFPGQGDRRRRRVQGDFHMLNFRRTPGQSVRYRVCLRGGNVPTRRCFRRRLNSAGRSGINVSLWLNDRGGPGRWRAIWSVGGGRVATWRFRLPPEGV